MVSNCWLLDVILTQGGTLALIFFLKVDHYHFKELQFLCDSHYQRNAHINGFMQVHVLFVIKMFFQLYHVVDISLHPPPQHFILCLISHSLWLFCPKWGNFLALFIGLTDINGISVGELKERRTYWSFPSVSACNELVLGTKLSVKVKV